MEDPAVPPVQPTPQERGEHPSTPVQAEVAPVGSSPDTAFSAPAVPERLPAMRDLDQLAIELDAIDRTLAQLDQPVATAAP